MSVSTGTGSSSRSLTKRTDLSDTSLDWESHVILRFPSEIAQRVRQYLDEDAHHTSDRMRLSFDSNLRTGQIQFDHHKMGFSLYDLPTICEVMKTLDNTTFYKVTDLSQMIVCSTPVEKSSRHEGGGSKEGIPSIEEADGDEGRGTFEWPHGLCPPMRDARRKRFRRMKRKKYMDSGDVERELKRLLRSDLEAVSVRWEVVTAEENDQGQQSMELDESIDVGNQSPFGEGNYEYGLSLSESEGEQSSP